MPPVKSKKKEGVIKASHNRKRKWKHNLNDELHYNKEV